MKILNVNLQEGFILDGDHIIGAFDRYSKTLIGPREAFPTVPSEFEGYRFHHYVEGHFSITMWTNNGYKSIGEK